MDCIFCKIIKGEIPCRKIYEDDFTLAFLDIAEDVDGHTVVIPKKHMENILDCDVGTMHHVMDAVQRISIHYVENCGFTGVNLLNASGESAGQSVSHLHFHLIPRKPADGIDVWPKFTGSRLPVEQIHSLLEMGGDTDAAGNK